MNKDDKTKKQGAHGLSSATSALKEAKSFVVIGQVLKPHGVRGDVVVRVFCQNPEDFWKYAELWSEKERIVLVKRRRLSADQFVAHCDGYTTRNEAESLRGREISISRAVLPPLLNEFYVTDLEGLRVEDAETRILLGKVSAVQDFGAGVVLEVIDINAPHRAVGMFPFRHEAIADIDLESGRILVYVRFLV